MRTHPGIEPILSTVMYFRLHSINTKLIGANFRQVSSTRLIQRLEFSYFSKVNGSSRAWGTGCYFGLEGTTRKLEVE